IAEGEMHPTVAFLGLSGLEDRPGAGERLGRRYPNRVQTGAPTGVVEGFGQAVEFGRVGRSHRDQSWQAGRGWTSANGAGPSRFHGGRLRRRLLGGRRLTAW